MGSFEAPPAGELWTVWVEYEEPTCGCRSCKVHPRRERVTTVSARAEDEVGAMARGEEIAEGKGYGPPMAATHAKRMGVAT